MENIYHFHLETCLCYFLTDILRLYIHNESIKLNQQFVLNHTLSVTFTLIYELEAYFESELFMDAMNRNKND